MADLLDLMNETKRCRLLARGWSQVPGLGSGLTWRAPDGGLYTEPEAFLLLEGRDFTQGGADEREA